MDAVVGAILLKIVSKDLPGSGILSNISFMFLSTLLWNCGYQATQLAPRSPGFELSAACQLYAMANFSSSHYLQGVLPSMTGEHADPYVFCLANNRLKKEFRGYLWSTPSDSWATTEFFKATKGSFPSNILLFLVVCFPDLETFSVQMFLPPTPAEILILFHHIKSGITGSTY